MQSPLRTPVEHGVWLRSEALAAGYDDSTIARFVRSGAWHRVRHGAYTAGEHWAGLPETERHRVAVRAVLRSARSDAVVSHTSSALEYAAPVWDLALDAVHLTRRDGKSGRKEAGVVQHRGRLEDDQVITRNGVAVTSAARTGIDVTRITDVEHGLVVVNGLLHGQHTTTEELVAMHQQMTAWPGSLTTQLVLRLCDGRIESVGESRAFFLFWSQGLPLPVPQYQVRDAWGDLVGRVDFAWPEHRVFLEFDGRVKYSRLVGEGQTVVDVVLREKRREELIRELTGWRCIRLVWADLLHPERTAARIRELLRRPGLVG